MEMDTISVPRVPIGSSNVITYIRFIRFLCFHFKFQNSAGGYSSLRNGPSAGASFHYLYPGPGSRLRLRDAKGVVIFPWEDKYAPVLMPHVAYRMILDMSKLLQGPS